MATERQIEAAARALCEARDINPDTLFQILGDAYPVECVDTQGRQFFRAWRKWVPAMTAALAAAEAAEPGPSEDDVARVLAERREWCRDRGGYPCNYCGDPDSGCQELARAVLALFRALSSPPRQED